MTTPMDPIRLTDLAAGYGDKPVLAHITLSIGKGEVLIIIGPNGSGKTTLLRVLAGVLPWQSGTFLLDGSDRRLWPARKAARRIAYLPQYRDTPDLTVEALVESGRFPYTGFFRPLTTTDRAHVNDALAATNLLEKRGTPLARLSGGERQKAFWAMAMAQEADVLLLDEPLSFLDPHAQLALMDRVHDMADSGKTIVLVLHDLGMAMQHADRVVVMQDGAIAGHGTPESILNSPLLPDVFQVRMHTKQVDGLAFHRLDRLVPDPDGGRYQEKM